MNINALTAVQPEGGFDLFRLSKSKDIVDVCSNTLRKWHGEGLPFYQCDRTVFISKAELAAFIRRKAGAK